MGRSRRHVRAARVAGIIAARNRRQDRRGITIFRTIGIGLIFLSSSFIALVIAGVLGGIATWSYFSADLPEINTVEAQQFETTRIYDRNWTLLYEVNDPLTGFRTYSSFDDITNDGANDFMVDATVAAEDQTF